ncbi:MAG: hypothetical protein P8Z31_07900 [Gammaproteobacteria bacterium]|jgi:hypothetical protein
MRIMIDCADDETTERIRDLLNYNLATSNAEIKNVRISVRQEKDPSGNRLVRCRMLTQLTSDENIAIEEVQSSGEVALTRTIDRTSRTLQRRRTAGGHYGRP